ncbi:MAG: hypothetical protein KDD47_26350, partial [Acidobacteria bacterium]|nr:hypothetical protein [Acidobacteriota bacterium]
MRGTMAVWGMLAALAGPVFGQVAETAEEATEAARQPASGLERVASEPLAMGERITFRSGVLDSEVSMSLYLPEDFAVSSPDHTYPVLFLSGAHGERFFSTLAGIVRHLADRELMPETLVVSLGDVEALPEIYTHGMWGAEKIGGFGDPQKSLRHLEAEVFPYLASHYRANDYRMLLGVSGSALFPLYALTHARHLFRGTLLFAAADMIGMGETPEATFLDALESTVTATPGSWHLLYVGAADHDLEDREDYRTNLDQLASRFRRFPSLAVQVEVFPETDHYEVVIQGLLSALRQHFPRDRWSADYRALAAQPGNVLENLDRYYRDLSRDYGFAILPRADRWNSVNCLRFLTRYLIQQERTAEAVAVARRRVAYRPSEPAAHEGLADALEADGQLPLAVKAQQQALYLA